MRCLSLASEGIVSDDPGRLRRTPGLPRADWERFLRELDPDRVERRRRVTAEFRSAQAERDAERWARIRAADLAELTPDDIEQAIAVLQARIIRLRQRRTT